MFSAIKRIGSRKVSVRTAALVIAFVLFAVTAMAARYESLTVGTLKADKIERLSENAPLDITIDGVWTKTDADGNIEGYKAADSEVVINYDDLSTLTSQAATSGQSVFWCSPGVHYIVDMLDISTRAFPPGTGVVWSGVTAIAPEANAANDGKAFSIEWGLSGTTVTFTGAMSGVTTIHVAPICLMSGTASTTSYGTAGQVVQSMLHPVTVGVVSGTTTGFMDKPGDMSVYRLQNNSGVSVMPETHVNN